MPPRRASGFTCRRTRRLLRPDVIDRLGDAGVATFNFAVDAMDEKPGAAEGAGSGALVFRLFDQASNTVYGYTVFFNMNICRTNLEDIKQLTEVAHDNGIATDYHINESPMIDQPHFKHADENSTYITTEDFPRVDALIDWLIDKNRQGYKMVNSVKRLNDMRDFLRGKVRTVELPRRAKLDHHSRGWLARAMLPDVLGDV